MLRLFDEFFNTDHVPIHVPPELSLNVTIQIYNLIEIDLSHIQYWGCLIGLMEPNSNLNVQEYLLLLQNSPILPKLL